MKLLITGAYNWQDYQVSLLRKAGWEILYIEREDDLNNVDIFDVDAVVCNWLFVNHDIRKFPKLKFIQLLSAGLDRVSLDFIKEHGIYLFNAHGVYSIPIAEYVIFGVLQLYKNGKMLHINQRKHSWNKIRNVMEIFGKRVCIIGAGSVGTEIAKKFSAFSEDIYGVDIYPKDNKFMKAVYPINMLDTEIKESDIVILALPLTKETIGMFAKERFNNMKNDSIFVNVARGGLVIEEDLIEALATKLFGAVIDVFEIEPLPTNSDLWDMRNVIISPHNSFVSENNDLRMWNVIVGNLEYYLKRKRVITKEV